MKSINIKTQDQEIIIGLHQGDMTIVVGESQAANDSLEWSGTLLEGKSVTYEEAEKAIKALGPEWRFPTRQELESILDLSRHDPAVDTSKFPNINGAYHWTSTPCAWNKTSAVWVVSFSSGGVDGDLRSNGACVLAVRASQSL